MSGIPLVSFQLSLQTVITRFVENLKLLVMRQIYGRRDTRNTRESIFDIWAILLEIL